MKKERSINELLKLMLDHQECFNSRHSGLCYWSRVMGWEGLMSKEELNKIHSYIENNRPKNIRYIMGFVFYWTPGRLSPRIKWLQKHIKLTNK